MRHSSHVTRMRAAPHYAITHDTVSVSTYYLIVRYALWWPHDTRVRAHNWAQLNSLSACHTITAWHPPDADGLVVASRCHHIRVARVPRNGVDGARMTRKHLRTLWIRL